jgi:hypothetical protein
MAPPEISTRRLMKKPCFRANFFTICWKLIFFEETECFYMVAFINNLKKTIEIYRLKTKIKCGVMRKI